MNAENRWASVAFDLLTFHSSGHLFQAPWSKLKDRGLAVVPVGDGRWARNLPDGVGRSSVHSLTGAHRSSCLQGLEPGVVQLEWRCFCGNAAPAANAIWLVSLSP